MKTDRLKLSYNYNQKIFLAQRKENEIRNFHPTEAE
jgi:hypothetical protein